MTTERHQPMPGRLVAWLAFVAIVSAVNYAGQFSGVEPPKDVAYRYSSAVGIVVQYAIFLGVLLLIARGLPLRQTFALRRPVSWPRSFGLAGAGLFAIWLVSGALAPFLDATDEQGLVPEEWDPNRAGAFTAFFLAVTFVGPLVEELMFRGLGFALLAPYRTWVAILGTGVLFGPYHGLVATLPVLIVFGITIGWLRARTESLYPCIVLHTTFNGVALIVSITVLG